MRSNNLLIVKPDHSNIVGNAQTATSQRFVYTHRHSVVITKNALGSIIRFYKPTDYLKSCLLESSILVWIEINHACVMRTTRLLMSTFVSFEPPNTRRRILCCVEEHRSTVARREECACGR